MLLTLQQLPGIISARAVGRSIERPDAPVSFVVEFDPSRLTVEDVVTTTVKALEENPDPRYRDLSLEVVWMSTFGD